jgi:hypothetical protein
LGWDDFLTWYHSLDDQAVTSSNLTIPIYLIKIKHKVMWTYVNKSYPDTSSNNLNCWVEIILWSPHTHSWTWFIRERLLSRTRLIIRKSLLINLRCSIDNIYVNWKIYTSLIESRILFFSIEFFIIWLLLSIKLLIHLHATSVL